MQRTRPHPWDPLSKDEIQKACKRHGMFNRTTQKIMLLSDIE